MISYEKVNRGDILKIVGAGAPGFARNDDLVRVLERTRNGVNVENKHGDRCEFVFNCGAARLEETEWKNDFPTETPKARPTIKELDAILNSEEKRAIVVNDDGSISAVSQTTLS